MVHTVFSTRAGNYCKSLNAWREVAKIALFTTVVLLGLTLGATFEKTARAQSPQGGVTGHVYLEDTHQPARFATVSLQALVPGGVTLTNAEREQGSPLSVVTYTDLEGAFVVQELPPGTYMILAWLPGYISALARVNGNDESPKAAIRVLENSLPHVEVQNHGVTRINITLRRGATVSGSLTYDDGSPASGFEVTLSCPRTPTTIQARN